MLLRLRNIYTLLLTAFALFTGPESAQCYTIKGSLKHLTCFYPRVYLAVLNKIDDVYKTSYQDIIASADIDSAGSFILTGNDLPGDMRFYRLYVTKDARTRSAIYTGIRRNYILLAMNNSKDLTINCEDFCTPLFTYSIQGSSENAAMVVVQNMLNDFHAAYSDSLSASKKDFLKNKEYNSLKQFADTTNNLMAGLWAMTEMNYTANNNNDLPFLDAFAERFKKKGSATQYSSLLDEQLQLLHYKEEGRHFRPPLYLFVLVCALLICSAGLNIYFAMKKTQITFLTATANDEKDAGVTTVSDEDTIKALIGSLTIKEREILQMIHEGLSNKEIADKLNVEVSTIKTHVSRIYQKTDIKNRKEVAAVARYL